MTEAARDRLTGVILLAVSVIWIVLVLATFPENAGSPTSARTFPLIAGIGLAVLSIILLAGTFAGEASGASTKGKMDALEWRALAATFGLLAAYVALLHFVGFLIATIVALAAFLYIVLGKRSPMLLIGYPLGFAFGIWFILGKLLAVYLPRGTLINLF